MRYFTGSAPEIALIDGDYKVKWVDLEEGKSGEYNPDDPFDVAFLRFDFLYMGEVVEDGSYCTLMPVNTPESVLKRALERIMDEIKPKCIDGDCPRKVIEELSWITPDWVKSEEDENQEEKLVCAECGNDSFRVYCTCSVDDVRMYCTKCGGREFKNNSNEVF